MKPRIFRIILGILLLGLLLSGATSCGLKQYMKLTITTEGSGTVTPISGTKYVVGTMVLLKTTPADGWVFSVWEGTDGAQVVSSTTEDNTHTIVMDTNKSIKAVFVRTYPLTVNVVGDGFVNGELISPKGTVFLAEDSDVELTAFPNLEWVFNHWEGDLTGNANPASIKMSSSKSVTAVFEEAAVKYTLTITNSGSGTFSPPSGTKYAAGRIASLSALPYNFTPWIFGGWGGANGAEVTWDNKILMNADKSVVACFQRLPYTY